MNHPPIPNAPPPGDDMPWRPPQCETPFTPTDEDTASPPAEEMQSSTFVRRDNPWFSRGVGNAATSGTVDKNPGQVASSPEPEPTPDPVVQSDMPQSGPWSSPPGTVRDYETERPPRQRSEPTSPSELDIHLTAETMDKALGLLVPHDLPSEVALDDAAPQPSTTEPSINKEEIIEGPMSPGDPDSVWNHPGRYEARLATTITNVGKLFECAAEQGKLVHLAGVVTADEAKLKLIDAGGLSAEGQRENLLAAAQDAERSITFCTRPSPDCPAELVVGPDHFTAPAVDDWHFCTDKASIQIQTVYKTPDAIPENEMVTSTYISMETTENEGKALLEIMSKHGKVLCVMGGGLSVEDSRSYEKCQEMFGPGTFASTVITGYIGTVEDLDTGLAAVRQATLEMSVYPEAEVDQILADVRRIGLEKKLIQGDWATVLE
jgi:hypothetical protein